MTRQPDTQSTITQSNNSVTKRTPVDTPNATEYFEPTFSGPNFHQYRLIRQFPATGGEADIWLVIRDNEYYILKHYRFGIDPKIEVLEKIREISEKNYHHLIRLLEFGFDDETKRWFEILEYAKNGSLRDLMQGQQISIVQFKTIISEIVQGIDTLHKSNILHLDLKPSNILVRSLRPLNLILTDFGISTLLNIDLSRQITSTKGTPMYWAPEQLGNVVGKEADYWSLGVIAFEILQKHHPFAGLNHHLILSTLSTRGIQVPSELQPRLSILLKGLLTRNPHRRWGKCEIDKWLAGRQNIPVHYEQELPSEQELKLPYDFRNEKIFNLHDLSYAIISNPEAWDDAKRHVGRGYLTRWLEKTDQWAASVEIDKSIETYKDEDERLLFIAARFNLEIQFTLFGKPLDISHIVEYLGKYLRRENDDREKRIVSMIFSGDLFRVYQIFTSITGQSDEGSQIQQMFSWLQANTRGIDEKNRLYDYLRVLKIREQIGPPQGWDTNAVLNLADIREKFLKQGYNTDAKTCEQDLIVAVKQALLSYDSESDLLVALAAMSEEFGDKISVSECLKKAINSDVRVVSLLFAKNYGLLRFKRYKKLTKDYEHNLYTLSSDPWQESDVFWNKMFFILIRGGDYKRALSVSERLIEIHPESGEGFAMRGMSLFKLGRIKEADYFLSSKKVKNSTSPLVWQIIGDYYSELGDIRKAEDAYQKGIDFDRINIGCLLGLIKIYAVQKQYQNVIDLCNTSLVEYPDNGKILLPMADAQSASGNISEAIHSYEHYLTQDPDDTNARKSLAMCQIKLKKYTEADKSVSLLLEKGAFDPQILRLKAYLLLISGKIVDAISYLDATLEAEPSDIWTLRIKADAYISLKEYGQALRCIDTILLIEQDNFLFSEKKGKILLNLGFSKEAVIYLKHAIDGGRVSAELFAAYADALRIQISSRYGAKPILQEGEIPHLTYRVSHSYLTLWQKEDLNPDEISLLHEAVQWYDRSIAQGGDIRYISNRKGIVATLCGDYKQANQDFLRASSTREKDPAYLANLAILYIIQGDTEKGTALFHQGLNTYTKHPYFLDCCAGFYYSTKKDSEYAIELCGQAIAANLLRDPVIYYHLYLIQSSLGREREMHITKELIQSIDPWFDLSLG
jgi:serine/threonine protein kinase/predicted Zn-dependent protease